jgi:peptidoglycan/LPS O-acetylase OafA/YrhL
MTAATLETPVVRDPSQRHDYFPFIDGMRAIAVIAVIVYHLRPTRLPGGFLGVDVFFVISGFVVSASIDLKVKGRRLPLVFYARRIRRVFPALVVVVLVTLLFTLMVVPLSFISPTLPRMALWSLLGQANRALVATHGDYFGPLSDLNPFAHLWSLGVEEQFYLVAPFIFSLWLARGRLRLLGVALLCVTSAASIVRAAGLMHAGDAVFAFYSVTSRFWQIGVGVLLHQLLTRGERETSALRMPSRTRSIIVWSSVALLAFAFVRGRPTATPWPDAVAPAVATLGLIACLLGQEAASVVGRALSSGLAVAIGRRSYSLYLWHWPVFVLFRWTIGLESKPIALAALGLTVALAEVSYRLVESPFRSRIARRVPPTVVIAVGLVVVLTAYGTCRVMIHNSADLSASTVMRNVGVWFPGAAAPTPKTPGCQLSAPLTQSSVATTEITRSGCPGPASPYTLFVLGDSHAAMYVTAVEEFVLETGNHAVVVQASGCGFALAEGIGVDNPQCRPLVAEMLRVVTERAKPGDAVLMASLRVPRLTEQWNASRNVAQGTALLLASQSAQDADTARWRKSLAPLAGRGINFVFEAPPPVFPASPFRCSDWFNRSNPSCRPGFSISRSAFTRYRAPVLEDMNRLARELPGASVWDPVPSLCDATTCHAVRNGKPLFYDGDHLTTLGNYRVAPSLIEHLSRLPRPPSS